MLTSQDLKLDEEYEKEKIIRYLEFYRDHIIPKGLSPREFDTIMKRLEGKKLSQTERNYLSRSIRPKLAAAKILCELHLEDLINNRSKRYTQGLIQKLAHLDLPIKEQKYRQSDKIRRLIDKMLKAGRICILTGAGISKGSGIITYRGQDGRWSEYDEKLFSEQQLKKNPEETIAALKKLRDEMALAHPNEAHMALARLEKLFSSTIIITQNIDGLHQRAGSTRIIELHGNITRNKKKFGKLLPAATLFGEALDHKSYRHAKNLIDDADIILIIGTSGYFDYIRDLIRDTPAFKAEINPEDSQFRDLTNLSIKGKAEWILPQIYNQLLIENLLDAFYDIELDKCIEAIYLFGSIAQKKRKLPNDIDLLLILRKGISKKKELDIRNFLTKKIFAEFAMKSNINITGKEKFFKELDSVKKDIIENGILLYGRDILTKSNTPP